MHAPGAHASFRARKHRACARETNDALNLVESYVVLLPPPPPSLPPPPPPLLLLLLQVEQARAVLPRALRAVRAGDARAAQPQAKLCGRKAQPNCHDATWHVWCRLIAVVVVVVVVVRGGCRKRLSRHARHGCCQPGSICDGGGGNSWRRCGCWRCRCCCCCCIIGWIARPYEAHAWIVCWHHQRRPLIPRRRMGGAGRAGTCTI